MRTRITACCTAIALVCSAATALAQGQGSSPNGRPFVSLQSEIDSLVGRVDSLESAQAATNAAIASLQQQNVALQAQIASNKGDINSLQTQVAHNSQLISALQSQVQALENALNMKQNVIHGLCPHGEAVRTVFSDGSLWCDTPGYLTIANTTTAGTTVQPGFTECARAYCPNGYIPISPGYFAEGTEVTASWVTQTSRFSGYASACFHNSISYYLTAYVFATCLRQPDY